MRVAVAGGTGLVGKLAVTELRAAGHEPVVLARSQGVDLITGANLVERLSGCDTVIDVTNIVTTRKRTSVDFFSRATGNLLTAARRCGVRQLITLSIVGCDRVDLGYYFGKRAQEELVRSGDVPWTVLRATQFFEFPEPLMASRSPVVPMPDMLSQPVAATDVAKALVDQVTLPPAGMAPDMAGPQKLRMADMARRIIRARRQRRLVLPVRLPGKAGKAVSDGGLLPRGEFVSGSLTFDDHLAVLRSAAAER